MTTPGEQGRFDGFDVLDQASHWDQVTQGVVLRRLGPPMPLAFFTQDESAVARALLDRLLGQDTDPKIDLVADLDSRLALDATDGWRHADLPHDGDAWRQSLAALDDDARAMYGRGFAQCTQGEQMAGVQRVQDSADGRWHGWPGKQVWSLWTRYACAAFYAHPWAWNEIGFGGPAYPRGYKNIGIGKREPWEKPERQPQDPVTWSQRAEQARNAHRAQVDRQ